MKLITKYIQKKIINMKNILPLLFLLISSMILGQAPNISYSSQNNYITNNSLNLTPINSGGIPTYRTRVSTLAGWEGAIFSSTYPNGFAWPIATTQANGLVYTLDDYWPCIRKVYPDGNTEVLAGKHITNMYPLEGGTIIMGYSDGQGSNAEFNNPKGIVADSSGNIYVADTGNHRIRKITPSGLVTTIAGSGINDEINGNGLSAGFSFPYSITIDRIGNIYVVDLPTFTSTFVTWPNINTKAVIRKIDTMGNVTTLAGNRFGANGGVDGQGSLASFKYSLDISTDSLGNIYVADTGNYKIRKITPTGLVSTIYYSVGIYPSGIEIDNDDNIYFSDLYLSSIRRITTDGLSNWTQSTYYAGSGYSETGSDNTINGLGNVARFYEPNGITIDSNKNLYVADRSTQRIRKIALLQPYTISPNLPNGLNFDSLTGVISGTPIVTSPLTTYTITAANYSGVSTTTISFSISLLSTCSGGTTIWNGSSWSAGTPTLTVAAQIDGPYVASTATSFSTCDLLVNSSLTINNNAYVEVLNDITVDPSGTLLVLSGGKLIPKSDSSLSYGQVTVQRTTTNLKLYDYTYWSSPVNTIINTALLPTNWWMNHTFTFETQNFFDIQTQIGATITPGADGQDDNGDAWTLVNPNDSFINAKGYAAMVYPSGTYPRTETVSFTGTLHTGIINYPLVLSENSVSTNDDFNLVGNPYSASIFADDFINSNINNISGTLNFWSHTGTLSSAYPGLAQLNFSPNDYAYYNLSGGVNASFGGKTPSGYIASGQGFLVEADNAANLEFKPSFMAPGYLNNTSVNFFRSVNDKKYKVSMRTELGLYSQQLINYNNNTSLDYEKGWDFKQPEGRLSLKFYSIENSINYKIQARGDFNIEDVVKLGYFSAVAETFTISLDSIEGIENVYIKDNGELHTLPYTFTTEMGEFNDRLELVYQNTLGIDPVSLDVIKIVPNPSSGITEILNYNGDESPIIYNTLGQEVKIEFINNNNSIQFNVKELSAGLYFIKIDNIVFYLSFKYLAVIFPTMADITDIIINTQRG